MLYALGIRASCFPLSLMDEASEADLSLGDLRKSWVSRPRKHVRSFVL